MSNPSYNDTILESINNFRKNPGSSQKYFQTLAKALKRAKKEEQGKELEAYSNEITSIPSNTPLQVSNGLQRTAEDQLLNIIKGTGKVGIMTDLKLKERCDYFTTSNDGALSMADSGELDSFICRVAVSELDPNRRIREAVTSEDYQFIGVASCDYKDDPITVIVLATDVVEAEEIDYGEDQELKEAFDLFDVWNTGKLDEKAIKTAFESLGFDKDSYSVYRAIINMNGNNNVKKNGGVDWPTFRDTVKELCGDLETKEGLRTLFELFVDSPDKDKISADTMVRVSKEIGDSITYNEIVRVLKRSAENGNDIDFEEFYKIMQNYNELNPSTED